MSIMGIVINSKFKISRISLRGEGAIYTQMKAGIDYARIIIFRRKL